MPVDSSECSPDFSESFLEQCSVSPESLFDFLSSQSVLSGRLKTMPFVRTGARRNGSLRIFEEKS